MVVARVQRDYIIALREAPREPVPPSALGVCVQRGRWVAAAGAWRESAQAGWAAWV